MALNASKSKNQGNGFKSDPLESGGYPARLAGVVDLGLQPQRAYQGQEKQPAYEILTIYEFSDEFLKDEDGNELKDKPRWLSESFPLYPLTSDRAKSTIRYLAIDPEAKKGGDWTKLIETPVTIGVVKSPSKKDPSKVYNNIDTVTIMRAKDAAKLDKMVNEPIVLDLDTPDLEMFKRLPEWIQKRITETNLEYKGSKLEALIAAAGGAEAVKAATKTETKSKTEATQADLDDEIPF